MNEAWPGSHSGSLSHLCTRPHIDPHFSEDQPESLQIRQMMDESDDDFQELCASFFQRVKKNGPKEVSKEKKTQKVSSSTQISKPKRNKPTASKSKTPRGPNERKTCPGSQVPRTQKHGALKRPETEPAPPENTGGGVHTSAVLQDSAWSTQTGNQSEPLPERTPEVICTILNQGPENFLKAKATTDSLSQPPPPCLTATAPSPSKPRAAELVLQRMQQFKRADPKRLKRASKACLLEAAPEENVPKDPQDVMAVNGCGPRLPTTESDTAVALDLQQELGQEPASAPNDSLEETGLFFCQICQKNLSAMNVTRRQQHVNRCLDEAEKALRFPMPQIPECPICGKPFLTLKSRISHLKQCAVKMEISPRLLLQAVQLQTAQPTGASGTPAPSLSDGAGCLKRKGATTKKEPRKRRKVTEPEAPSEDLLMAMALSRSEMEQKAVPAALRLGNAFAERTRLGAEKKTRKKKAPASPPQLLVQDAETTGRQIEDRVAQLLSEEVEPSSTPPLPASRILEEELARGSRTLRPPGGPQNLLWEASALTGAGALESFYTASLVPPLVPQRPATECSLPVGQGLTREPMQLPWPPKPPELNVGTPPSAHGTHPVGHSLQSPAPSASQRERQALQDLLELAGERLPTSPYSRDLAGSGGAAGMDLSLGGLPLTGFVLPAKEKYPEEGDQTSLALGLLVADFSAMVNNPHLSDIQFQTDSGEVLCAHKFVLYARCPLLMQHVNSEAFLAEEDGDLRRQRVLLSDVSTEAAQAFLHYLYAADTILTPQLAPDLRSLAQRFGVSELVHLCEQVPFVMDAEGGQGKEQEDEDADGRVETFRELLRSVWLGEGEGAEALLKPEDYEEDREKVNEEEMEEIYEFAATQRKLLQGEKAPEPEEEANLLGEDGPVSREIPTSEQDKEQPENAEQVELSGQGRDETLAKWGNMRQSTLLPPSDQALNGGEKAEAPEGAQAPPCSSSPAQGWAERQECSPLCSVDDDNDQQPFSSPQAGYPELSRVTSDWEEGNRTIQEREVEGFHPPAHQQASPSSSCFFPPQPHQGRSPRQPRPHPRRPSDLSPPIPQLQGTASSMASQNSSPKPKRARRLPSSREDPGQKDKECSSGLERRGKGVLIFPEKSPPMDLTQSGPGRRSSRPETSPRKMNREDEVILLLDSDEELELEQTKAKSFLNSPSEDKKVLEVSAKSSELFSIIDLDAEQEPPQSPPGSQAPLPQEMERQLRASADEDSTTDTSWLVPATPLASRSCDCSSQTQITGLGARPPADPLALPKPRALLENRDEPEATSKFSVIIPQMSSPRLGPAAPGGSDGRRQACSSPSSPRHRRLPRASPLAPWPILGGLADLPGQLPRHLPPARSPAAQAPVSEVVEVEDSEDEQEAASQQASSSPLLDGDPPIPAEDWCWHMEPLSPIPIDHLNLERTGPLSTSSPSSRAEGTPDSRDCRSLALLGTTPIRGSYTGRRKSREKSSRAGSPGSHQQSFLNSALWDDWNEEDQRSSEALPLPQTPHTDGAQRSHELQTPRADRKKNLPPKVPITPMPRYSIMETPVLKKELDRFGVRPLPKRQMVLKLKEIFQYTHQMLESDSEDEGQSSQLPLEAPCSQTYTTQTSKTSRASGHTQMEAPPGHVPQRSKGPAKTKGPQHHKQQPGGSISALSMSPAKEEPLDPGGDAQLPASQESTATSVDSGDSSCSSQSSSCEFGAALESAGEEEAVGASQAAVQAVATEEAVRRYIRSQPALYRKVLLYQPLELAELQAELKQQGIRVASGKLLDFLDTQCITFTTAATRKEKLGRKRRQPIGKKRGRASRPAPCSPVPAVSSL
ncbi:structure-specific endonuclease subunit SLX4 isoform X2 [Moschus berezovskii]|uniref:structure-specific endonuclease subunit SLX4 isoform X2 n=1 Tax=Moschus berezovskii TaxID=68408 RepID=UPI002444D794|nr:structure-specific endonuclease subunit SLX4 isoform X2 [Moschus berezovskii]